MEPQPPQNWHVVYAPGSAPAFVLKIFSECYTRRPSSYVALGISTSWRLLGFQPRARDVHEAYQAETETEASGSETEARPRRS